MSGAGKQVDREWSEWRELKVMWGNPLYHRLLMWALSLPSPACQWRIPTFREAWTGMVKL